MKSIDLTHYNKDYIKDKKYTKHLSLSDYDFARNMYSLIWKKKKSVKSGKDIPSEIRLWNSGNFTVKYLNENNLYHRIHGYSFIENDKGYYGINGYLIQFIDFCFLKDLFRNKHIFNITSEDIEEIQNRESVLLNLWKCNRLSYEHNTFDFDKIINVKLVNLSYLDIEKSIIWGNDKICYDSNGLCSVNLLNRLNNNGDRSFGNLILEQDVKKMTDLFGMRCFTQPAFVNKDNEKFYLNSGKFHRIDGPAIIKKDGSEIYYLHGNEVTKEFHSNYFEERVCKMEDYIELYMRYQFLL